MSLTKQQVLADLRQHFAEIFSDPAYRPYLDDCAAIGAFLSGKQAVEPFLKELEERLARRLFQRLGYNATARGKELQTGRREYYEKQARGQFGDWQKRLVARNAGKPVERDAAYSKLLTEELGVIETQAGFKLYQDDTGHQKAEMIMPLKAEKFRAQLRDARPFKDPTIGPDHGEYTHRVQWALIVIAGILQNPVVKVYQSIGEVSWTVTANFGLWDALVDRQPVGAPGLPQPFPFYKSDEHDFRTPEALLTWLCQPQQQASYPLIAGFLRARKEKRKHVVDNDGRANPLVANYMARKLFGVPYDRLDKEQRDYVDDFEQRGQQVGVLKPHASKPIYARA